MVEQAIDRRSEKHRAALADLAAGTHTPKEIAFRLGHKTVEAVYMLRHRFEKSSGKKLPRHETRGAKPRS